MYFLENKRGLFYAEDGEVDDLDFAKEFKTIEDAATVMQALQPGWTIFEEIVD